MEDAKLLERLYEVVKQNKGEPYDAAIGQSASFPYFYHLSDLRQNLVSWLPITKNMRVLECNAECGALTGALLAMAGEVVSVSRREKAVRIIRERYKDESGRLTVCREGELDPSEFDVILIAGDTYRFREDLAEFGSLLKKNGRLYLADENRIGLKYLAGCQEDYRGGYFTGLEDYPKGEARGGRGYTRKEYESMLKEAGFGRLTFYYPYPDYQFPSRIYSDAWLPQKGELCDDSWNLDRDRLKLFDECRAYDTLLSEGLYGEFANSFLIEAEI